MSYYFGEGIKLELKHESQAKLYITDQNIEQMEQMVLECKHEIS